VHYDKQEHVITTNKLLKKIAGDLHCLYLDLHKLFVDKQGRLYAKYTADGLHLTTQIVKPVYLKN